MHAKSSPAKLIGGGSAPMMREPDPLSEQVSQALLGVSVSVCEGGGDWTRIRTPDTYEGWVATSCLTDPPAGWGPPWAEVTDLWANLRPAADTETASVMAVMIGTRLPLVHRDDRWAKLLLPDGRFAWLETHRVRAPASRAPRLPSPAAVCRTARRFLGVPYLWGGCTPLGIDCSGLVQLVLGLHGVEIFRDATPQMSQGTPVETPDAADLVFFGPEEQPEQVSHVGIMLDRSRFMHALGSREVRINRLSDEPYCRRFRGARRFVPR